MCSPLFDGVCFRGMIFGKSCPHERKTKKKNYNNNDKRATARHDTQKPEKYEKKVLTKNIPIVLNHLHQLAILPFVPLPNSKHPLHWYLDFTRHCQMLHHIKHPRVARTALVPLPFT